VTRELNVYLYEEKTGVLSEDQLGHLQFRYESGAKRPLSVRMPVCGEEYDRFYAEPFFDNLTPEGSALEIIAGKFHVSEDNTFSILHKIGGFSMKSDLCEYIAQRPHNHQYRRTTGRRARN